jgi:hypothetical protein
MYFVGVILVLIFISSLLRHSDPPALREARAAYWQEPDLPRLKTIAKKLDRLKTQIEDEVGLDISSPEGASLEEGDLEWEDCVEPGYESEKKLWWRVKKESARITRQITDLERHEQHQRIRNTPAERLRIGGRRDQLSGPKNHLP